MGKENPLTERKKTINPDTAQLKTAIGDIRFALRRFKNEIRRRGNRNALWKF